LLCLIDKELATRAAGEDHVDALSSVLADFGGKVREAINAADGPAPTSFSSDAQIALILS
jgi:hypothetical protein